MKTRELLNLGVPKGEAMDLVKKAIERWVRSDCGSKNKSAVRAMIAELAENPEVYLSDDIFGQAAKALTQKQQAEARYVPRDSPAYYKRWGDDIEDTAIVQMENACKLPISVRGALMPDAHYRVWFAHRRCTGY